MQDADPRRLRRAVAQLSTCADEDVEWIMGTLTPAQRERLAVLVEESGAAPEAVNVADRRLDALLQTAGAPLGARLRLALDRDGGDGRLTPRVRDALAVAARDVAATLPLPATSVTTPTGLRAFFTRLRPGARR